MEGVGLVMGLPGLVQSCVHGYRFICTMSDMDKAAIVLRLKYRVEESRLVLWGRYWGLLPTPGDESQTQNSQQNFDDLLQIPGIDSLIDDILKQVMASLQEVRSMSEKYSRLQPTSSEKSEQAFAESSSTPGKRGTTIKIRWALKGKTDYETLLANLTSLNDGLEKLLPRQEKTRLRQALPAELLAEERMHPTGEDASTLIAAFGGKSGGSKIASNVKREQQAQMVEHYTIRRRRSSIKSDLSNDQFEDDNESIHENVKSNDNYDKQNAQARLPDTSMKLPLEWFIDMTEKTNGFSMELLRLPDGFEPGIIPDTIQQSEESSLPTDTPSFVDEYVFVEWRNYDDTAADEQLQMALDTRREEVSHLFSRDSEESNNIVMKCLGYVLPDKYKMGLVFRPPPDFAGEPISLNDLMRNDFNSESAVIPALDERIDLAERLSTSLYQLQCSGWLHRNISSHNVVFFPTAVEAGSRTVMLSQPKLVGWQTARYDDQVTAQQTEYTSVRRKNEWRMEELLYVHPARPAARIRFRRSFDVYALGIVLAEIAFWEPIDVLGGASQGSLMSQFNQSSDSPQLQRFSELVIYTCKKELDGEVGRKYKSAVIWALEGVKIWHAQQAIAHPESTEQELEKEIGLEREFFWKVVSQLTAPLGSRS